jgi:hypothetical protein
MIGLSLTWYIKQPEKLTVCKDFGRCSQKAVGDALMAIKIVDHDFLGPLASTDAIKDKSGAYAILYEKECK